MLIPIYEMLIKTAKDLVKDFSVNNIKETWEISEKNPEEFLKKIMPFLDSFNSDPKRNRIEIEKLRKDFLLGTDNIIELIGLPGSLNARIKPDSTKIKRDFSENVTKVWGLSEKNPDEFISMITPIINRILQDNPTYNIKELGNILFKGTEGILGLTGVAGNFSIKLVNPYKQQTTPTKIQERPKIVEKRGPNKIQQRFPSGIPQYTPQNPGDKIQKRFPRLVVKTAAILRLISKSY